MAETKKYIEKVQNRGGSIFYIKGVDERIKQSLPDDDSKYLDGTGNFSVPIKASTEEIGATNNAEWHKTMSFIGVQASLLDDAPTPAKTYSTYGLYVAHKLPNEADDLLHILDDSAMWGENDQGHGKHAIRTYSNADRLTFDSKRKIITVHGENETRIDNIVLPDGYGTSYSYSSRNNHRIIIAKGVSDGSGGRKPNTVSSDFQFQDGDIWIDIS